MTAVTTRAWVLAALGCAGSAHGGLVTVAVTSTGGGAPEDTVVVFDPKDSRAPAAHLDATIDQFDRQFVPKVSVLRTGTTVTFKNSDHTRHQVYSFSATKTFTLKLYAGSPDQPIVFDKAGLAVLGCNIHDNMLAFVAVVDSPYFGKVAKSGSVTLNLPAGHYRLRVWHPNLSQPVAPQEIDVSASDLTIPLTLDLSSNTPGVTPWPE